ncbi:MAG TPA: hypothetical protein VFP60_05190 [Pseudolabrys sp.]|nr:hypothetical protein [Pseudolabrys sp.]
MDSDVGGWLMLLIDVVFVVVLAAAIIYAGYMWRKRPRNETTNRIRDEVTRENFRRPGG